MTYSLNGGQFYNLKPKPLFFAIFIFEKAKKNENLTMLKEYPKNKQMAKD